MDSKIKHVGRILMNCLFCGKTLAQPQYSLVRCRDDNCLKANVYYAVENNAIIDASFLCELENRKKYAIYYTESDKQCSIYDISLGAGKNLLCQFSYVSMILTPQNVKNKIITYLTFL